MCGILIKIWVFQGLCGTKINDKFLAGSSECRNSVPINPLKLCCPVRPGEWFQFSWPEGNRVPWCPGFTVWFTLHRSGGWATCKAHTRGSWQRHLQTERCAPWVTNHVYLGCWVRISGFSGSPGCDSTLEGAKGNILGFNLQIISSWSLLCLLYAKIWWMGIRRNALWAGDTEDFSWRPLTRAKLKAFKESNIRFCGPLQLPYFSSKIV